MTADVLAFSVARSSVITVLTMQGEWNLVFHGGGGGGGGGISTIYAILVLRNDRKLKYIFIFSKITSTRQGLSSREQREKLISQIPPCIRQISHNARFCERNVHTSAHFCWKMVHYGIWDWCIVEFVQ